MRGEGEAVMTPGVLAIVREPAEFARLAAELSVSGVSVQRAEDLLDAVLQHLNTPSRLVICDSDIVDWKTALNVLARLPPKVTVVFLARLADDDLWLEMLNAGAFDLLANPCEKAELNRVVRSVFRTKFGLSAQAG